MKDLCSAVILGALIAAILFLNVGCSQFKEAADVVKDKDFTTGCVFVIEKLKIDTGALGVADVGANVCKLKCSPIDKLPNGYKFKAKNQQAGCEGSVGYGDNVNVEVEDADG